MFGFCRHNENLSVIDLYLINDYDCFKSQCDHIKKCRLFKIGGSKSGLLIKEQKGIMAIYLFKYNGPHTIPTICR